MGMIGIDFGNDSCVVSVWRNGRIDIVTDEFNCRYTPSMVAFEEFKRTFGASARSQWTTNVESTMFDLKSVLDVNLTKRWKFNVLKFTENSLDSTVFFNISFLQEKLSLCPYQALAMLFTKIKTDAQVFMQTTEQTLGCVISVPAYFNDQERKAVLLAAAIARLDCHFLIKETTAVAINYSHYKKFAKPINVIFIDFGQSSIQISACKLSEKRLEVIEEIYEKIGGRDIDEKIADHFMNIHNIRGGERKNKTFCALLLHEVEKLKKKMSLSVQRHELESKHLFNGESVSMDRTEMEKICTPLFVKIEIIMRLCLERSQFRIDEIHSVELVGGSSNIPIIERLVSKVFGKVPIGTLNRDDAVARGCLLKSIFSTKRKGFKIIEKPFHDEINNFNVNFSGMKDLVRIFQVHRFLKCDCRDSFQITEDVFVGFVDMEKKLAKYDLEEEKRQTARSNLDKYLLEHAKPGGLLENCNAKTKKEFNDTRAFDCGTKDQYVDLFNYWTRKLEKLRNRKPTRLAEEEDDNGVNSVTIDVSPHSKDHRCNPNQVLVKKLTFNDCDDVTIIDSNQSTSSNSEPGYRCYRKGFRSRYRRLNRNANKSHNATLACKQPVGSQSLLLRQNGPKQKKVTWCCFL